MMFAKRKARVALIVGVGLVVAALAAATASASSGEFTRAEVSANGTHASLAGFVEWTEPCEEWPDEPWDPESVPSWSCSVWTSYATIGPTSSGESCSSPGRNLDSITDGIEVIWEDEKRTGEGATNFDLSDVSLPHGADTLLLCLSALEERTDFHCGWLGGWDCHGIYSSSNFSFDSALLELPSPPPAPPDSPKSPSPPPAPADSAWPLSVSGPGEPSASPAAGVVGQPRRRCHRRSRSRTRRGIIPSPKVEKQARNRCGRRLPR